MFLDDRPLFNGEKLTKLYWILGDDDVPPYCRETISKRGQELSRDHSQPTRNRVGVNIVGMVTWQIETTKFRIF